MKIGTGKYSHYKFFKKLCNEEYTKSELNNFIKTLFIIAESHIRFNYKKVKQLVNLGEDGIKEIASESIATLFQYSTSSKQFIIVDKLRAWDTPIDSEQEALFFLNKIIANRVEQHICYSLRRADPLFSRILETINYLIRKGNYRKVNSLGKIYIIENSSSRILRNLIPIDEFQDLPLNLFYNRKILLKSLFDYIKTETNYFPAIPLNELICVLKHVNLSDYLGSDSVNDVSSKFEINEIVNFGLSFTEKKLKSSYLDKGKLNKVEYNNFKQALKTLANDLSNGGINPRLHSYLIPYFNGLTNEEYYKKYHNILEYLLKLLKRKIAEALCVIIYAYYDYVAYVF